jgi:hypothetical protein
LFNKIYVHVGLDKTGSSYLQSGLEFLAKDAALHKTSYPLLKTQEDFQAIRSGNAWQLSLQLLSEFHPQFAPERVQQLTQELIAAADPAKANLLISSEHFCFAEPQRLHYLLEVLQTYAQHVEIIVFARALPQLFYSRYHQQVKRHGESRSYDEDFIREASQQLLAKVSLLGDLEQPVHILDYCRQGLLPMLLELIGEPPVTEFGFADVQVNRSLTVVEMNLLRKINSLFKSLELSIAISNRWLYSMPEAVSAKHSGDATLELAVFAEQVSSQSERLVSPVAQQLLARLQAVPRPTQPAPEAPASANDAEAFMIALEEISKFTSAQQRLQSYARRLKPSKDIFDPVHYLLLNPDVLKAGVDPLEHYLKYGRKEGRMAAYSNISLLGKA